MQVIQPSATRAAARYLVRLGRTVASLSILGLACWSIAGVIRLVRILDAPSSVSHAEEPVAVDGPSPPDVMQDQLDGTWIVSSEGEHSGLSPAALIASLTDLRQKSVLSLILGNTEPRHPVTANRSSITVSETPRHDTAVLASSLHGSGRKALTTEIALVQESPSPPMLEIWPRGVLPRLTRLNARGTPVAQIVQGPIPPHDIAKYCRESGLLIAFDPAATETTAEITCQTKFGIVRVYGIPSSQWGGFQYLAIVEQPASPSDHGPETMVRKQ